MKAYKAHDKDLKCRNYQYRVGGIYTTTYAQICENGFHACSNPMDVWEYYPDIFNNRYTEVELSDTIVTHENKSCASKIEIKKEIKLEELILNSIEYILQNTGTLPENENIATGKNNSHIVSIYEGCNAATSGHYSHSITRQNDCNSATCGYISHSVTMGSFSDASANGNSSFAVTLGWNSNASTTGNNSRALTKGAFSCAVTTGSASIAEAKGNKSIACSLGRNSYVKASLGNLLIAVEYDIYHNILGGKCQFVDGINILPDTLYKLVNGEFVKA
jgi:hypothetical protein